MHQTKPKTQNSDVANALNSIVLCPNYKLITERFYFSESLEIMSINKR